MTNLHTNRQVTVASLLLLFLTAFAFNLEYRGRTHARHRQARAVRIDDHDGDHVRWHAHAFDLNHAGADEDADLPGLAEAPTAYVVIEVDLEPDSPVYIAAAPSPSFQSALQLQTRAPPSFSI